MFDGKYHGHADELLGDADEDGAVRRRGAGCRPTRRGTCASSSTTTSMRSSASWRAGDVACVLAEPAITNTGVILPADGFHAGLRRLDRRAARC